MFIAFDSCFSFSISIQLDWAFLFFLTMNLSGQVKSLYGNLLGLISTSYSFSQGEIQSGSYFQPFLFSFVFVLFISIKLFIIQSLFKMDNRFLTNLDGGVENGGMFSRQQIQQLTQQVMQLYSNGKEQLQPSDLARCMVDTYRGMNKHFIPTGYELSSFARVFDGTKRGKITAEDILATATRMFLANEKNSTALR